MPESPARLAEDDKRRAEMVKSVLELIEQLSSPAPPARATEDAKVNDKKPWSGCNVCNGRDAHVDGCPNRTVFVTGMREAYLPDGYQLFGVVSGMEIERHHNRAWREDVRRREADLNAAREQVAGYERRVDSLLADLRNAARERDDAKTRNGLAHAALLDYFTDNQIGPDLAPRITEILSRMRTAEAKLAEVTKERDVSRYDRAMWRSRAEQAESRLARLAEPSEEMLDVLGPLVYAVMTYTEAGTKPAWVPRGNSLKQSEARGVARYILETALEARAAKESKG